ncbi:glutamate--cysteine ligase [Microbacterium sp. NPDC079995]|uniref:glutamate--cysteine ligase n=1 Tax=unclassified Microbacterium TaxID=2609290 RepID=UPI00344D0A73
MVAAGGPRTPSQVTTTSRPGASQKYTARTLGVEEEFLVVDGRTLRPAPRADDVLRVLAEAANEGSSPALGSIAFHAEMKREQIEVVSPPVRTRSELAAVIGEGRRRVDRAAMSVGARAVPLATAPHACDSQVSDSPRYTEMAARFSATAREQLTCGMHVHVAVDSPEEGVGVLDRIRPWLPVILALSANSPFWRGTDTGYASYRYQAWMRWPTAGPTDLFGSLDAYRREVAAMLKAGVCLDEGMIYFDARLSTHAPTVEVRIADVCLRADDAVTLPLLVRALVDRAAADWRAGIAPPAWPTTILRLASWRASKEGIGGELMHPELSHLVPADIAVQALLDHVRGHYFSVVECDQVEAGVASIVEKGAGAAIQRDAMRVTGTASAALWEALRFGMDTSPAQ